MNCWVRMVLTLEPRNHQMAPVLYFLDIRRLLLASKKKYFKFNFTILEKIMKKITDLGLVSNKVDFGLAGLRWQCCWHNNIWLLIWSLHQHVDQCLLFILWLHWNDWSRRGRRRRCFDENDLVVFLCGRKRNWTTDRPKKKIQNLRIKHRTKFLKEYFTELRDIQVLVVKHAHRRVCE